MGRLDNSKIYLAGPVEADNDCLSWRDEISNKLLNINESLIVWNPVKHPCWIDYKITPEEQRKDKKILDNIIKQKSIQFDRLRANEYIRKICLRLTSACDFVICKIGGPTVGTFEELSLIRSQNKPVLFLSENELDSCWRAAQFHDIGQWFINQDELISYIADIDNNVIQVDNINWIFLKGIWNET